MDYTTNLNLKKPGSDDFIDTADINGNMDVIDGSISNLKKFQAAGGTGTAITLTGIELVDGFQTTFVILASNSGAATTINAKPLYKPGTITAPKLAPGKAATVWYNSAGGCFFIKASAEGTATAGDVLAGQTFSNDDDVGLTGTLILTGSAVSADVITGKTFYNTDAKAKLTGTYSNIKSLQVIEGTIYNATSKDFTISSVDPTKSVVFIEIGKTEVPTYSSYEMGVSIVNATTVKVEMSTAFTTTLYFKLTVVEFNGVKTKQSGSATGVYPQPTNVAISNVAANKSLIFVSAKISAGNADYNANAIYPVLTTSTNLSLRTKADYGTAITFLWQIIEFI